MIKTWVSGAVPREYGAGIWVVNPVSPAPAAPPALVHVAAARVTNDEPVGLPIVAAHDRGHQSGFAGLGHGPSEPFAQLTEVPTRTRSGDAHVYR